ncbi:MAG: MFS transporter [Hyphomicrobiaceae bacterium]|nr:MFS transporter [Hyphomicrobiaceae bacterium]
MTDLSGASSYRRNVLLLAAAQALFMTTQSMGIATTPLAGHALLGADKSLATLPIFLNHAGIMLTTIPASLLMGRIGRRAGFTIGAVLAILFGAMAVWAIHARSFELLCASALLQGSAAAFAWYYRFAAADASPDEFKPKAISYVMAGGIVAGLLGPQIAKWTVDWFAPVTFMGVYVAITITGALSVLLMQALRIPRLTAAERAEGGRPIGEIMRQPAYVAAVISSMFGYGVMTLVMSATPLAMLACGFQFGHSATVIQAHIVAMFLPSFFTGHLIRKFGELTIIAVGALIQVGCALVNLAGIEFANFLIANALVGLGWNFTYVGGSTLLTTTYRPAERARVQASHDFLVYATTATAAALAGFLQQKAGWTAINLAALPLMGIVMLSALWLGMKQRTAARTQPAE